MAQGIDGKVSPHHEVPHHMWLMAFLRTKFLSLVISSPTPRDRLQVAVREREAVGRRWKWSAIQWLHLTTRSLLDSVLRSGFSFAESPPSCSRPLLDPFNVAAPLAETHFPGFPLRSHQPGFCHEVALV